VFIPWEGTTFEKGKGEEQEKRFKKKAAGLAEKGEQKPSEEKINESVTLLGTKQGCGGG